LPRALIPPGKVSPQIPPPQTTTQSPAAQAPSAPDPPSTERPAAPPSTARKHTRSEAAAVRRNARSQRQHEFSLKNWLQQLGIGSRSPRGRRELPLPPRGPNTPPNPSNPSPSDCAPCILILLKKIPPPGNRSPEWTQPKTR